MRIGILETGAPPAGLVATHGRYDAMLRALIGPGHDYTTYDVAAGDLPDRPEDYDAYIVTGSPAGVYEDFPWIAALKDFLRAAKGMAKLVGICFGHQIMAEAFGGRVEKSDKGWGVGLHRYDVVSPEDWMDDAATVAVPASHQDQIVAKPPHAHVVAASAFSPFGALAYDDQPAISFQFHPEFDPAFAAALIEGRRDGVPGADAAIESLNAPNDNARVGRWIRTFLEA